MKRLRILLSLIFLSISGSCFAQYTPPDFPPDTNQLGFVKKGQDYDIKIYNSVGMGLAYGGTGIKLSASYGHVGVSVAMGDVKGTPLAVRPSMHHSDNGSTDVVMLNKNTLKGIGFLAGIDVWFEPEILYCNLSYLSMGKLFDEIPMHGVAGSFGGNIPIFKGLYLDIGIVGGVAFFKREKLVPYEIEINNGSSAAGRWNGIYLGLGYRF